MTSLSRTLLGTACAAAVMVAATTPAMAHDHDGIGAGEVIAGALVIGGIAAIAAAGGNHHDNDYYARAGYDSSGYGYDDPRGEARAAVDHCIRAAESSAAHASYGRADVTDIGEIRETRKGYQVRGRIVVDGVGRGWGRGDDGDSGSFKCKVEYGQIVDLDFSGLRGL